MNINMPAKGGSAFGGKKGSTLFLRAVIYLFGLIVLAVCIIIVGTIYGRDPGIFLPLLLGILTTAVPFFFALHQGLLLLRYIDKNTAFSLHSVKAIKNIKHAALAISVLYALGMPYIVYLADKDDAPGAVLFGLVLMFAPLVVSVFAAVLEKLLHSALEIQAENDLTV